LVAYWSKGRIKSNLIKREKEERAGEWLPWERRSQHFRKAEKEGGRARSVVPESNGRLELKKKVREPNLWGGKKLNAASCEMAVAGKKGNGCSSGYAAEKKKRKTWSRRPINHSVGREKKTVRGLGERK